MPKKISYFNLVQKWEVFMLFFTVYYYCIYVVSVRQNYLEAFSLTSIPTWYNGRYILKVFRNNRWFSGHLIDCTFHKGPNNLYKGQIPHVLSVVLKTYAYPCWRVLNHGYNDVFSTADSWFYHTLYVMYLQSVVSSIQVIIFIVPNLI
jgi:hypothetical protein